MDKQQYEAAAERLKAVNTVIEGLNPAIRGDAFKVLQSYVTGELATVGTGGEGSDGDGMGGNGGVATVTANALDDEAIIDLVEKYETNTASDNGVLVTAIYGVRRGNQQRPE
jgi:hypothetical protein